MYSACIENAVMNCLWKKTLPELGKQTNQGKTFA